MRRNDRKLCDEKAREILKSAEYGILSLASAGGTPYGVPLNFCVEGENIYFHCAREGRKVDLLRENERVSFCVVGKTEILQERLSTAYESTIVSGICTPVEGEEKQKALEGLLHKYSEPFFAKGLETIDRMSAVTSVYKIRIQTITGKANRK